MPTADIQNPLDEDGALERPTGWWRRQAGAATAVGAVATVIAVVVYRWWELGLRAPLSYRGDALTNQMLIKGIRENGWWLHNPALGAPFGQYNHDFPVGGETLHLLALKGLSFFVSDDLVVLNLYYLANFATVAASAFLLCRYLRFRADVSVLVALVYSVLPFHLWHGQEHLFRSAYFMVPPATLVLLWLFDPEAAFGRRGEWSKGRIAFAAATAVGVAGTDTIAAAFVALLVVAAGILVAVRDRRFDRLLAPAAFLAIVVVTFLAFNIATLLFAAEHGKNPVAGARTGRHTVFYGLKISDMLLPPVDHRVPELRSANASLRDTPVRSEGGQYLGFIGAAAFLAAVYLAFTRGIGRPEDRGPEAARPSPESLTGRLAVLTLVSVLIATVHGFSAVIAGLGFTQVRTWNRFVVLIALFCLIIAAVAIQWVLERLTRPVATAVSAVLVVLAVLDQTNPVLDHDLRRRAFTADRAFVQAIESHMPARSGIFQLPIHEYPEGGSRVRMIDYDHIRGYLHSRALRWNYGAVKGRAQADWQLRLRGMSPPELIRAVCATGFSGLWLDRFGYVDGDPTEGNVMGVIGRAPDIVSEHERLVFWDLRPKCQVLRRAGDDELDALRAELLPDQPRATR